MNPYLHLVSEIARLKQEGKSYPLGGFPDCPRPKTDPDAPKVLIFSPHPDDEVIIGGAALRLLRECKWNVANVAVTLGRRPERKASRLSELKDCCRCIGFELIETAPGGLDHVELPMRKRDPVLWANSVRIIADILTSQQPRLILFPHEDDWNSTHIGTNALMRDALASLPADFSCYTLETEFWGAMNAPNLLVEIGPDDLADMITALTYHVGEVGRNPYHLTLTAWMQDNVRRGSELVGGQGGPACDFVFATVYRLRRWQQGKWDSTYSGGRQMGAKDDLSALLA